MRYPLDPTIYNPKIFQALAPLPPDPPTESQLLAPGAQLFVRVSFVELHGNWGEVALPNLLRQLPTWPPAGRSDLEVLVLDTEGRTLDRYPTSAAPGKGRFQPKHRVEAEIGGGRTR